MALEFIGPIAWSIPTTPTPYPTKPDNKRPIREWLGQLSIIATANTMVRFGQLFQRSPDNKVFYEPSHIYFLD